MRSFFYFIVIFSLLSFIVPPALAIYDPLSVPNNKMGVHILHPSEIEQAASLVNSNGGDWGYVTVPIQPSERDQEKWQTFFDQARTLHLIPIVRITTIPFGGTWASGQDTDLVDFANFLNELTWPVKNRYIVLFNEVNRASEWGGQVDPAKYAQIVKKARIIFQERNSDFFLLGPALDNALPESDTSMTSANYLKAMETADPGIWSYFDGWASHSYPNPDFTAPPSKTGWQSIVSYRTETTTLELSPKPVFITETGWDQSKLPPSLLDSYWKQAWTIWSTDPQVAAITPFVLIGGDQFRQFSLISSGNALTNSGNTLKELKKTAGSPQLTSPTEATPRPSPVNLNHTSPAKESTYIPNFLLKIENFFRRLFGLLEKRELTLAGQSLTVEVAQTPKEWEKGLSGRESLAANAGMLFIFPNVHTPTFWMKDMNFPLDIIWIRDDRVAEISYFVPVSQSGVLTTYSPSVGVDKVLEVLAGFAEANNIKIGDPITLSN